MLFHSITGALDKKINEHPTPQSRRRTLAGAGPMDAASAQGFVVSYGIVTLDRRCRERTDGHEDTYRLHKRQMARPSAERRQEFRRHGDFR